MPDQDQEDAVAGPHARLQLRELRTDVLQRGASVDRRRIALGVLGQARDVVVEQPEPCLRSARQRDRLFVKQVAMLGIAAEAGHDQQVALRRFRRRGREERGERERRPHASPCRLRYPHSLQARATATRKSTGMFHSSLRSFTVEPLFV